MKNEMYKKKEGIVGEKRRGEIRCEKKEELRNVFCFGGVERVTRPSPFASVVVYGTQA